MKAVRRFFRTPKGLVILVLLVFAAVSGLVSSFSLIGPGLVGAVLAAALVDAPILRWRGRSWSFPSGAVLSGAFVAMVLSPHEPWTVPVATAVVAVVSKYLFRGRTANIFNPAAFAILVTFYALRTGQNWWGALPDAGVGGVVLLLVAGAFIADRVNRVPLVLTFLGSYFLLFTLSAVVGDPRIVAEIFRAPDANAALFFAFFILSDPPTSPIKYRDQIICGVIVAVSSYAIFHWLGAAHYLLSGVLIGNVWEAWRRRREDARRTARRFEQSRGQREGTALPPLASASTTPLP
jgi:Na+-translocating ferredoxin:NAD+ oxidoreductase RnfD subunit